MVEHSGRKVFNMKLLKNEKGLALPLVLIILVVLTLLAAALWHYSISEVTMSVRDEKRARAYYIARAGAESVARYVMVNPEVLDLIPDENDVITSKTLEYIAGEDVEVGDVEVELKRIASNRIEVTGIGTVDKGTADEIIQRVSLILETQEPFDGVVYAMDGLNFQEGVTVNGDIVSGGSVKWQNETVTEHPNSDYTLKDHSPINFPSPTFFEASDSYTDIINIPNNQTGEPIDSMPAVAYQSITMGNNSNLTINATTESIFLEAQIFDMNQGSTLTLKTSSANDLIIVVDSIRLRNVRVEGDGKAQLYVRNSINVQTPEAIIDDEALLEVYLDEGCIMTMQANAKFAGLVYGPQAIVEIGGNADFEGSMIVSQLVGSIGSTVIGSSETHLDHKYGWAMLGLDYGGYWMVHWIR